MAPEPVREAAGAFAGESSFGAGGSASGGRTGQFGGNGFGAGKSFAARQGQFGATLPPTPKPKQASTSAVGFAPFTTPNVRSAGGAQGDNNFLSAKSRSAAAPKQSGAGSSFSGAKGGVLPPVGAVTARAKTASLAGVPPPLTTAERSAGRGPGVVTTPGPPAVPRSAAVPPLLSPPTPKPLPPPLPNRAPPAWAQTDDYLSLDAYDLSRPILEVYAQKKLTQLYPWQRDCLFARGALSGGKNLVYCAPTSGGKTLVSELLMLRRVPQLGPALFILPFVSIVNEKERHLKDLVQFVGQGVGG